MDVVRELEGVRILLVEDDEDTREVLSLGLHLAGAEVVGVRSARQAMDEMAIWRPDVIVSDIGLPDQDGLGLMRRIRELPTADGGRVPAAAVTAFTLSDDLHEPFTAGFQRHFRKPVDTRTLFSAIAELASSGPVERRRAQRRQGVDVLTDDRRTSDRRETASSSLG